MARTSGIRRFGEGELEALRVIECLKKSGLEIRDIRQFMDWCTEGAATYPQRLELFQRQRANVEEELVRLNKVLDMLKFKCWYYEQAMADGGEERVKSMIPHQLPEEIQASYQNAHGE